MPGPQPKPAALRLIEGNPSKRPINLADGVNPEVVLPDPPDWLNDDALAEWARAGAELVGLGLMARIDRAAFANYCQSFGQLCQLERTFLQRQIAAAQAAADPVEGMAQPFFVKTPTGFDRESKIVKLIAELREQVHRYGQSFGLSPAARMRVQASDGPQLSLPGMDPANDGGGQPRLVDFA